MLKTKMSEGIEDARVKMRIVEKLSKGCRQLRISIAEEDGERCPVVGSRALAVAAGLGLETIGLDLHLEVGLAHDSDRDRGCGLSDALGWADSTPLNQHQGHA